MLRKYAKEKGFSVFGEYVDDGISGTTFERASFKKMIDDVEAKKTQLLSSKTFLASAEIMLS
jgi:DNA invertase Pin-like site-specific DNA recombinase